MRFGVREICDVVLRAKSTQTLGSRKFYKNEPVLYFDTLKTSSLEGASTTVYATGGRGNTRLIAWEGERTLTFTMEDALISPEGFAILSGAGLIAATANTPIYVHTTYQYEVKEKNTIELPEEACWNKYNSNDEYFHQSADIFVMTMTDGEIDAEPCIPYSVADDHKTLTCYSHAGTIDVGDVVLVDYYVKRIGGAQLIEITADKFGGNYYLEASTLFRRESDGVDMPAEFIIPNCKVQSNFTFSMASSGDPSTFTFTMDAFPDYTKFDKTHKVLAAIQVIEDKYEDEIEERTACVIQTVESMTDGMTVTFDNDSTEDNCKLTVTGNNVDGLKYRQDMWDTQGEFTDNGVSAGEIKITMPILEKGVYRLVTQNPTLKYFTKDPSIHKDELSGAYTKDKTYTITDEALELLVAITNEKGPISVKLYDGENKLVKSFAIKNEVSFAKVCKVEDTEIKADSGVTTVEYAVNGESFTATKPARVVSDDKVCIRLDADADVTANGYVVTKDTATINEFIYSVTAKNRDIKFVISKKGTM